MKKLQEVKKICDDFKTRQEEQWYRRDELIKDTLDEIDQYMPLEDDGSAQYVEVMSTYEALKDEKEGLQYAYLR